MLINEIGEKIIVFDCVKGNHFRAKYREISEIERSTKLDSIVKVWRKFLTWLLTSWP